MPGNNTVIGSVRAVLAADTAQFDTAVERSGGVLDGFAQVSQQAQTKFTRSSKALQNASLNLSRQFTDIGVSLAGGSSPFLVLTQQLPQVADAFAVARGQGLGFGAVVKGMAAQAAPLIPALAGVGLAVGAVVGAFGLFERAVDKNTKHATTWGDTWKATVKVVGQHIMDGPVGDALKWLSDQWSATLDAITKAAFEGFTRLTAFVSASFKTIVANWSNLPGAFDAIFTAAANVGIKATAWLVNGNIRLFNKLIEGWNSLGPLKAPTIPEINFDAMMLKPSQAAAKASADLEAFYQQDLKTIQAAGRGFLAEVAAQADKEYEARQKGTKAAADHAKALKKVAEAADAAAEAYKRLAERVKAGADRLRDAARDVGLTALQKTQRDLRTLLADVAQFEGGLKTIVGSEVKLLAEAAEQRAKALEVGNAEIVKTEEGLAGARKVAQKLTDDADDIADAFGRARFGVDNMFRSLKSGNFGGFILDMQDMLKGLSTLASSGPAGLASIGSIVANTIGGKAGRAIGGGLGIAAGGLGLGAFAGTAAGAAALGSVGLGAGAIGAIAGLAGPIGLAAGALFAAAKLFNLGGKPSNKGAGLALTETGLGALSGNKRNQETEQAVTAAGQAILAGEQVLRDAGIKLGATVNGLVIGTRDLSQIYLTNGKAVKAAVGDAAAAADAGLKAVLQSAEYADAAQKTLVENMLAAGKGFEDITAALQGYAQAQTVSGNLADRILQLTDPKAFDLKSVKDAIAEERESYEKLAAQGFLTADQLAGINAQLDRLQGLQLDDVLKRYAGAVDAATAAAQGQVETLQGTYDAAVKALDEAADAEVAALEKTRDRLLQTADSLAAFRNELKAGLAAALSPGQALATARTAFASAAGSRDPETLAKLPELGKALISASEAGASSALELAADKAAVLRATDQAEAAARAQAAAAQGQIDALTASVAAYLPVNENLKSVADQLKSLGEISAQLKAAQDNLAAITAQAAAAISSASAQAAAAASAQAQALDATAAQLTAQAQPAPAVLAAAQAAAGDDADLAKAIAGELWATQGPVMLATLLQTQRTANNIDDVVNGQLAFKTNAA